MRLWLVALVLVAFSSVSFAGQAPIINLNAGLPLNVTPQEDACFDVSSGDCAALSANGNSTSIPLRKSAALTRGYYMFNISTLDRDKIPDAFVVFTTKGAFFSCAPSPPTLVVTPINNTLASGQLFNDQIIATGDTANASKFPLNDPLQAVYAVTTTNASWCVAPPAQVQINLIYGFSHELVESDNLYTFRLDITGNDMQTDTQSSEGSPKPYLQFSNLLFRTSRGQARDNSFLLYDFESNSFDVTNSSVAFNTPTAANMGSYDLVYDARYNVLKFREGTYGAALGLDQFELDTNSDLDKVPCSALGTFSASSFSDLNNPVGEYTVICVNLSSEHLGKQFYGVWKMVNSTCPNGNGCEGGLLQNKGRDTDVYLALLSTSHFSVTFNQITPANPNGQTTPVVQFLSSQSATGTVRYRHRPINDTNTSSFTPYSANSDSGGVTIHNVGIPNVTGNRFYEFYVFATIGNDTSTDDNNGQFYNFTTGDDLYNTSFDCLVSSVSVTPNCAGGADARCDANETVTMNVLFSGSQCPSSFYSQTDFSNANGTCMIENSGGQIVGVNGTCSTSPCQFLYIIPAFPPACAGQVMGGFASNLWNASIPPNPNAQFMSSTTNIVISPTFQFSSANCGAPVCTATECSGSLFGGTQTLTCTDLCGTYQREAECTPSLVGGAPVNQSIEGAAESVKTGIILPFATTFMPLIIILLLVFIVIFGVYTLLARLRH